MKNRRKYIAHLAFLAISLFCWNLLGAQNALYLSTGSQVKIDSGTIVTVTGNITLDTGATLSHHGILYLKNNGSASTWYDPNTSGNGMNGTGKVVFQGNSGINYSGFTRFHNVTINGGPVIFTSPGTLTVTNRLLLQKGVIHIDSGSALHITNPASDAIASHASNEGYSKSYINGSLIRNISVDSSTYDFPVGNQSNVHLLSFINKFLTGVSSLTASFDIKQGTDAGIDINQASSYITVNTNGVWYLQPLGSITGGSYGLRLSLDGFAGLIDDHFSILGRPFNSSIGEDWIIPSGSSIPEAGFSGRTVASGYTLRENMTNFTSTQFGIGMSYILLHSTLGDLNAKRVNAANIMLDWKTLSESSNRGFYLERRINNALIFSDLTYVDTKSLNGSSTSSLNYTFSDRNSFTGTSYYRLRQVSKDGTIAYSNIVTVSGAKPMIRFSPNPTKGILHISVPDHQVYTVLVIDGEGRTVMQQKGITTSYIQMNKLAAGVYTVVLYNATNIPVLAERIMLMK